MPLTYKEFDPRWGEYDEESYQKYGLQPDPRSGHGPSRVPFGPDEGLFLKTEKHDTFWMAVETDLKMGGKIYRNKNNGRIYSFEAQRKMGKEFEELEWTGQKLIPKKVKRKKKAVEKAFDVKAMER